MSRYKAQIQCEIEADSLSEAREKMLGIIDEEIKKLKASLTLERLPETEVT